MAYKIRFTNKRSSHARTISKHTYGVVRSDLSGRNALFVGKGTPSDPYDKSEATVFEVYADAVGALASWFAREDRAASSLWVKNPRIVET